jgi:hypothetical protein
MKIHDRRSFEHPAAGLYTGRKSASARVSDKDREPGHESAVDADWIEGSTETVGAPDAKSVRRHGSARHCNQPIRRSPEQPVDRHSVGLLGVNRTDEYARQTDRMAVVAFSRFYTASAFAVLVERRLTEPDIPPPFR